MPLGTNFLVVFFLPDGRWSRPYCGAGAWGSWKQWYSWCKARPVLFCLIDLQVSFLSRWVKEEPWVTSACRASVISTHPCERGPSGGEVCAVHGRFVQNPACCVWQHWGPPLHSSVSRVSPGVGEPGSPSEVNYSRPPLGKSMGYCFCQLGPGLAEKPNWEP